MSTNNRKEILVDGDVKVTIAESPGSPGLRSTLNGNIADLQASMPALPADLQAQFAKFKSQLPLGPSMPELPADLKIQFANFKSQLAGSSSSSSSSDLPADLKAQFEKFKLEYPSAMSAELQDQLSALSPEELKVRLSGPIDMHDLHVNLAMGKLPEDLQARMASTIANMPSVPADLQAQLASGQLPADIQAQLANSLLPADFQARLNLSGSAEELQARLKDMSPEQLQAQLTSSLSNFPSLNSAELQAKMSQFQMPAGLSAEEMQARMASFQMPAGLSAEDLQKQMANFQMPAGLSAEEMQARMASFQMPPGLSAEEMQARMASFQMPPGLTAEELQARMAGGLGDFNANTAEWQAHFKNSMGDLPQAPSAAEMQAHMDALSKNIPTDLSSANALASMVKPEYDFSFKDPEAEIKVDFNWLRRLFPTKTEEKVNLWLSVLHKNELDNVRHLRNVGSEGWKRVDLPLGVIGHIRAYLEAVEEEELDIPIPCAVDFSFKKVSEGKKPQAFRLNEKVPIQLSTMVNWGLMPDPYASK